MTEHDTDEQRIIKAWQKAGNPPWSIKDLSKALGVHADDRAGLRQLVRDMVRAGTLVRLAGRRYRIGTASDVVEGVIKRGRRGGLALIGDDGRPPKVPQAAMRTLMDGDRVRLRVEQKGPMRFVRILEVIERAHPRVTGVLRKADRYVFVEVDAAVFDGTVRLESDDPVAADATSGDVVEVGIDTWPSDLGGATGHAVRVLGRRGDLSVEIARLLLAAGVEVEIPADAEREAEAFGDAPDPAEVARREDLRPLPLCTIDGETARDFDDAVHAVDHGSHVEVTVAIADVSHYVRPGRALDEAAIARATSVYYPGTCVPMLPEALSNGLCSLRPRVDRLCMAARFEVRSSGEVASVRFFEAVMSSHARLTYTTAQRWLDAHDGVAADAGGAGDAAQAASKHAGEEAGDAVPTHVGPSLLALRKAARALRTARMQRGALDLDMAEPLVHLDDTGEPVSIEDHPRLEAHRIIEDLMVATNEAVARFCEAEGVPAIYRIHEPPDPEKAATFLQLVANLRGGGATREQARRQTPGAKLTRALADLQDSPLRPVLEQLLLRAMMRARYSAENLGHYGLASKAYLHFTSPIRRYPDLAVHRALRAWMQRGHAGDVHTLSEARGSMDRLAAHCSDREQAATKVERALDDLFGCRLAQGHIGETVEGVIRGAAEHGIYVRLEPLRVDGFVHVRDVHERYLTYDEVAMRLFADRGGFHVGVGDRVLVTIEGVDLIERRVSLRLDEVLQVMPVPGARAAHAPQARGRGRQRGGGRNRGRGGHGSSGGQESASGRKRGSRGVRFSAGGGKRGARTARARSAPSTGPWQVVLEDDGPAQTSSAPPRPPARLVSERPGDYATASDYGDTDTTRGRDD